MAYELHWQVRGVVKRYFGTVTAKDIVESVIDVERSPRFDSIRYVINDFLGAEALDATGLDIEELAAIDRGAFATNPNIRIAVVTRRADVAGLATQYAESPVNVYPTRVFASLQDAQAWLGAVGDQT